MFSIFIIFYFRQFVLMQLLHEMSGFIVPDSKTIKQPQIMRSEYPGVILGNDEVNENINEM